MPTLDPAPAAAEALVAYLNTLTGAGDALEDVGDIRRGWPEHPQDLDLSSGPVITVTHGSPERTPCSPRTVDTDSDPHRYRVAYLSIPLQIDVWAPYQVQRDEWAAKVRAAMHNGLPRREGLWIASTDYYDRPLSFDLTGSRTFDSEGGATAGEWRWSAQLSCKSDEIAIPASSPEITTAVIEPTITVAEVEVTDPDTEVTA